ncbi:MAG TPA: FkbM family methyltransferase [Candidatus Acidoferrum sp.]|nr:FkbM family methyltransferase [Candidatus Acidoferrum sp.]
MKVTETNTRIFDQAHYQKLIEARGATIRSLVTELGTKLKFATALDAGCGLGFFAEILRSAGLAVTAFDGRLSNVEEARRRYPGVAFLVGDVQDSHVLDLGSFDLVLCFGLLYHLENPFAAIRNLRRLTGKGMLLESMCLPTEQPVLQLLEEPSLEDQSLTDIAMYPSEGSLVKMLYRSGFSHVYKIDPMPDHEQFCETPAQARRRTVLFASFEPVSSPHLIPFPEPIVRTDPWAKPVSLPAKAIRRAAKFTRKPREEKFRSFAFRWIRWFPLPIRLPFGSRWIARNTVLDQRILNGAFEEDEVGFVQRLLRPGQTVLDVGAHHGFYSLLFSKCVGPSGKIFAFEPSPGEREKLKFHLKLNSCSNVRVEVNALGSAVDDLDLYVVKGVEDSCNSLRPPAVTDPTEKVRVHVSTLDEFLNSRSLTEVDFVKVDIEGAELDFLRGARKIFSLSKRPVFMMEISDVRTGPWGYKAQEILNFLQEKNYLWFEIQESGTLSLADTSRGAYDANYAAIPRERASEFASLQKRNES